MKIKKITYPKHRVNSMLDCQFIQMIIWLLIMQVECYNTWKLVKPIHQSLNHYARNYLF